MSNSLSCDSYTYSDICKLAMNCIYLYDKCVDLSCGTFPDEERCTLVRTDGSNVDLCEWDIEESECKVGKVENFA